MENWEEILAQLLVEFKYVQTFDEGLKYAQYDCWQSFKNDGYEPREAIYEDLSFV